MSHSINEATIEYMKSLSESEFFEKIVPISDSTGRGEQFYTFARVKYPLSKSDIRDHVEYGPLGNSLQDELLDEVMSTIQEEGVDAESVDLCDYISKTFESQINSFIDDYRSMQSMDTGSEPDELALFPAIPDTFVNGDEDGVGVIDPETGDLFTVGEVNDPNQDDTVIEKYLEEVVLQADSFLHGHMNSTFSHNASAAADCIADALAYMCENQM